MRFDVLYDPKAEKQLEKLPKQISKRIILKIGEAGKTGRGIEPIKDEGYGYKIRIGGYFISLIRHKYVAHKKQKLLKIENYLSVYFLIRLLKSR